jgi:hypothetical protein
MLWPLELLTLPQRCRLEQFRLEQLETANPLRMSRMTQFGCTASNQPQTALNLGFFMDGMASATWAELFDGKLFRLTLFVFAGHVITPFTAVALKPNKISHVNSSLGVTLRDPFFGEAHDGNRTHDLFLTKEVLYRLSYVGIFINQ